MRNLSICKEIKALFFMRFNRVTGGWRKRHNEDLRSLHSSPSILRKFVRENEMGSACSTNEEQEFVKDIDGKARRKDRPLARLGYRWVDNIKMDLR
jgi:hypothetical protein